MTLHTIYSAWITHAIPGHGHDTQTYSYTCSMPMYYSCTVIYDSTCICSNLISTRDRLLRLLIPALEKTLAITVAFISNTITLCVYVVVTIVFSMQSPL